MDGDGGGGGDGGNNMDGKVDAGGALQRGDTLPAYGRRHVLQCLTAGRDGRGEDDEDTEHSRVNVSSNRAGGGEGEVGGVDATAGDGACSAASRAGAGHMRASGRARDSAATAAAAVWGETLPPAAAAAASTVAGSGSSSNAAQQVPAAGAVSVGSGGEAAPVRRRRRPAAAVACPTPRRPNPHARAKQPHQPRLGHRSPHNPLPSAPHRHEADDEHVVALAEAARPIHRLLVGGGEPVGLEEDDAGGGREGEGAHLLGQPHHRGGGGGAAVAAARSVRR